MAIQKALNFIRFNILGDASSTTVDLDLERDVYDDTTGEFPAGALADRLSSGRTARPVGAVVGSSGGAPGFTVALNYPKLTLTFGSAPSASTFTISVGLLF